MRSDKSTARGMSRLAFLASSPIDVTDSKPTDQDGDTRLNEDKTESVRRDNRKSVRVELKGVRRILGSDPLVSHWSVRTTG